jgi:transcriptional regulator with XRE-family HTH domain
MKDDESGLKRTYFDRKALETAIESIGWTPYKVAKEIGTTQTTILRILRGERSPRFEIIAACADVLGRSVDDFVKK